MFLSNDGDAAVPVTKAASAEVVAVLRTLLADTYAMYVQAQGAHWNVKGNDFAQYHALFAAIRDDVEGSIDPMAENILKMGADALGSVSEIQGTRTTRDSVSGSEARPLAAGLAAYNDELLDRLSQAFVVADSANEQGVANFLAERIDMHQKWRWQLKSSLGVAVA